MLYDISLNDMNKKNTYINLENDKVSDNEEISLQINICIFFIHII